MEISNSQNIKKFTQLYQPATIRASNQRTIGQVLLLFRLILCEALYFLAEFALKYHVYLIGLAIKPNFNDLLSTAFVYDSSIVSGLNIRPIKQYETALFEIEQF